MRIMANIMQKKLAKTITYIACQAPGEYGLFWNADGTMPWREFYWALQDDPELRFVREMHIQELIYLGLNLPFSLEGRRLHLRDKLQVPGYPAVVPPPRLYYGCPRKSYLHIRQQGLSAAHREFIPLAGSRAFAESLARRRDPKPILIEIQAGKAHDQGVGFRLAGPDLYLAEVVSIDCLVFPLLSAEKLLASAKPGKKEAPRASSPPSPAPGSFVLGADQFKTTVSPPATAGKDRQKIARGQNWKRGARKMRDKRIP
jgi:putative RNA 2'-phosphotransferase